MNTKMDIRKLNEALEVSRNSMNKRKEDLYKFSLTDEDMELAWEIASVGGCGAENEKVVQNIKTRILSKLIPAIDKMDGFQFSDLLGYLENRLREKTIEESSLSDERIALEFYVRVPVISEYSYCELTDSFLENREYIFTFSNEEESRGELVEVIELYVSLGRFTYSDNLTHFDTLIIEDEKKNEITKIEKEIREKFNILD